jgi:hypothetical protein
MSGPALLEMLAQVPDPRHLRGLRHPLPAILGLAVVAMLAGMKSLEAIAQFGRDRGRGLAHALGFRRAKTPTKSTLSDLFRALNVTAFEAILGQWLLARQGDADSLVVIDGKVLKGSRDGETPGLHLLSAFVPATAAVLGQLPVEARTNEHKAALRLLGVLPLAGKVVSGDAIFTHRDVAQKIRDGDGDYLLVVKDNQPELKAQIAAALDDDADFSPLPTQAESGCRASGRYHRQGARASRVPPTDQHHGPEPSAGLAGRRSGVRGRARPRRRRPTQRGGGVRDNESDAGAGRRGAAAGADAGPLGD